MFPEFDKKKMGQRLKNILKEKKITARDVQEYLSLSCVQTVYRWIEGVNIPCIDHLYALSLFTGVSMEYLVAGREREPAEDGWRRRCRDIFIYGEAGKNEIYGEKESILQKKGCCEEKHGKNSWRGEMRPMYWGRWFRSCSVDYRRMEAYIKKWKLFRLPEEISGL